VKGKLNTFRSASRLFERAQKQLLIAGALQAKYQLKPPDRVFEPHRIGAWKVLARRREQRARIRLERRLARIRLKKRLIRIRLKGQRARARLDRREPRDPLR
jgi:hypothetical protein